MTGNLIRNEQEAIEAIKSNMPTGGYEMLRASLDMAISALEKQISKRPRLSMNEQSGMFVDYADGHGEFKTQMNNWWRCPCCDAVVGQRVIVHKHTYDQGKRNYCENCGQAIDWRN